MVLKKSILGINYTVNPAFLVMTFGGDVNDNISPPSDRTLYAVF